MTYSRNQSEFTVLVTGAGGPLGVSIFKAFRQSIFHPRIVATDTDPRSAGLFRADAAYVLPSVTADEGAYLQRLGEICATEQVALACFGSESEMRCMAVVAESFEARTRAKLVLNPPALLDALMDKWNMIHALRAQALPVPDTVLASDPAAVRDFLAHHAFPLVLKPRHGSGSKNFFVIRDRDALGAIARYVPEPVLQEYLAPDDEEYTVGAYRSARDGFIGQIVFKRTLAAGLTYKAEVAHDQEIETTCRRLVESLGLWGPVNVQLRKTAAGIRIFEINPRFSSSTVMRAHFGFNEAELCLRDVVLREHLSPPIIEDGGVLRYWDELFLSPEEATGCCEGSRVSAGGSLLNAF